ncbi:aminopeptidase [Serratia microhaemolytica]|uniref:aminopeptidase n=1 Tax=Serratia microhaemolytica TaxID=2675110 RepID=UPI001F0BBFF4|nr:aminopeptidase [Serratia microhaemolytica]
MFSRFCLRAGLLVVALSTIASVSASTQPAKKEKEPAMGQFAVKQIRHIVTQFPGRMAGSDVEIQASSYLQIMFANMGYTVSAIPFRVLYPYVSKTGSKPAEQSIDATDTGSVTSNPSPQSATQQKASEQPTKSALKQQAAQSNAVSQNHATKADQATETANNKAIAKWHQAEQAKQPGDSKPEPKHTVTKWYQTIATTVVASKEGKSPKKIIVMAHFDSYAPLSDEDTEKHLGGPTLQGVDDNASGVGVMLELAERMKNIPTKYSLSFVASSAEELKALGAKNYLNHMTQQQRDDIVLMINLDSLITGENLYFHSGRTTPPEVAHKSRDRALALAKELGIEATTNPGSEKYPRGTGCCSDYKTFDEANIPVMAVEATNWSLGERNGYQQRTISPSFPEGVTWHRPHYDNLEYLETHLPGQLERRTREVVQILLPLLKELAEAEPTAQNH